MSEHTQDIEALERLADPEVAKALEPTLSTLERETELLVFVNPGCAVCPHQVRSAATVALASPNVVLEVVDASQEPELAAQYEVHAVPTTVVDDALIMVGVVRPDELALRLVERQGPDAAKRVFVGLVQGGHTSAAAERLADGRGTEAFIELWEQAAAAQSGDDDDQPTGRPTGGADDLGRKRRAFLLAVAEESALYDPFGLQPLVPRLLAGLEDGGPFTGDDDARADTATLLGLTGDEAARPLLERLADDPDPYVSEAAAAALEELE